MQQLPSPEVVSSYFDAGFMPLLGALRLRWPEEPEFSRAALWHLPGGVRLIDTPPEQFGIRILRLDDDAYDVCLVWNRTALHWARIAMALRARCGRCWRRWADLGLLDQPVLTPLRAAA